MFDYSFVDFDKTVFDCARFEEDVKHVFERYGVGHEDYRSTYLHSLCTVRPGEYDYSFEEQIKFLKDLGYKLGDSLLEELNDLLKADRYLFADTLSFLTWLRGCSKKIVLLTAGDKKFQLKKINNSGIKEYFDQVDILAGHKDRYLCSKINPSNQALFVNDSLRENLMVKECGSNILVVGKLPPNRYLSKDIKASGIPYFDTLTEIQQYVSELE